MLHLINFLCIEMLSLKYWNKIYKTKQITGKHQKTFFSAVRDIHVPWCSLLSNFISGFTDEKREVCTHTSKLIKVLSRKWAKHETKKSDRALRGSNIQMIWCTKAVTFRSTPTLHQTNLAIGAPQCVSRVCVWLIYWWSICKVCF